MQFDISIVIPCLNESENVDALVNAINEYMDTLESMYCEVIFVDDGSTDDTFERLKQASHESYKARIIKLSRNFGSHAALRAGICHARGNYTTYLAADLQYPLVVIGQLYRKCLEGHDLVRLERESNKDPFLKRILSRGYATLMRKFAVPQYPKNGFDIVMFNEKIRTELNENMEAHSSILLQLISLGFNQAAIMSDKQERTVGKTRWTFWKNIKLLIDSFVSYSYAPVRCICIFGCLFLLAGVMFCLFCLLSSQLYAKNIIIVVLLMGFGLTNISLWIMAEYLWRTFETAKQRKVFIIEQMADV